MYACMHVFSSERINCNLGDVQEQEASGGLSALGSHWATRSLCATQLAGILRRARGTPVVLEPGDKSSVFRMETGAFNHSSFARGEAEAEEAAAVLERRRLLGLLEAAWNASSSLLSLQGVGDQGVEEEGDGACPGGGGLGFSGGHEGLGFRSGHEPLHEAEDGFKGNQGGAAAMVSGRLQSPGAGGVARLGSDSVSAGSARREMPREMTRAQAGGLGLLGLDAHATSASAPNTRSRLPLNGEAGESTPNAGGKGREGGGGGGRGEGGQRGGGHEEDNLIQEDSVLIVVTVVYNNVVMLRKQVETLERFVLDDYHMIAAVDSSGNGCVCLCVCVCRGRGRGSFVLGDCHLNAAADSTRNGWLCMLAMNVRTREIEAPKCVSPQTSACVHTWMFTSVYARHIRSRIVFLSILSRVLIHILCVLYNDGGIPGLCVGIQAFLIASSNTCAGNRTRRHIVDVECAALEIECHMTPFSDSDGEFDVGNRPSWSHMRALNWLLQVPQKSPAISKRALLKIATHYKLF